MRRKGRHFILPTRPGDGKCGDDNTRQDKKEGAGDALQTVLHFFFRFLRYPIDGTGKVRAVTVDDTRKAGKNQTLMEARNSPLFPGSGSA